MSLPVRPRTVLLAVLCVLLVAVAVVWWTGRDQVTWSVEVHNADAVVDVDTDRVLVATFDDELVVLDREDGSERGVVQLPDEARVVQAVLVPGGSVLAQWHGGADAEGDTVAMFDADGEQLWSREDPVGLRILGVRGEAQVVALASHGPDRGIIGVGFDGAERWRRPLAAGLPTPLDTGGALLDIGVTLAPDRDGASSGAEIVDLDDGTTLGSLEAPAARIATVAYWHDTVLTGLRDGTVSLHVEGRPAALTGADDVRGSYFANVADGALVAEHRTGRWAIDLEQGTARPTTVELPSGTDVPHRVIGVAADEQIRVVDLGTGEEAGVSMGGAPAALGSGPDAVLVAEEQGRLASWRHGITRDDAGRLTLVDLDGVTHGRLTTTAAEVIDWWVADGHEALVVTKDLDLGEDREPNRVTLIGR